MSGWEGGNDRGDREDDLEAANALRQADRVFELVDARATLTPAIVCELNALAVDAIEPTAGAFRARDVEIAGSKHKPPPFGEVPALVADMCETLEREMAWNEIRRCAFVLWRVNWIHPFAEGNGRTARAACYLVLCVASGGRLPGTRTLPERIRGEVRGYYHALEEADRTWRGRHPRLNLTNLEGYLWRHVRAQLRDAAPS